MTILLIPLNNSTETLNSVLAISNALTFMGNVVMIKYNQFQNFYNYKFDQVIEISAKQNIPFVPSPIQQNYSTPQLQNNYPVASSQNYQSQFQPTTQINPNTTQFKTPSFQQLSSQNTQVVSSQNFGQVVPQSFVPPLGTVQSQGNVTPLPTYPQLKTPDNFLNPATTEITPLNLDELVDNSPKFSPSPKTIQPKA